MVDAGLECKECEVGNEHKCKKGMVGTYGGKDKYGRAKTFPEDEGTIMGGYTSVHVVHERFAVLIPKSYELKYAGPVMCAL